MQDKISAIRGLIVAVALAYAGQVAPSLADDDLSLFFSTARGNPRAEQHAEPALTLLPPELRLALQPDSAGTAVPTDTGAAGDSTTLETPDPASSSEDEFDLDDEFEGPRRMRRRLLDAMRESAPEGYEEAVRRYYEELLR